MKYALVTGGSRGIGRAISVKLAEMGYNIYVLYKSNDVEARKTAELIDQRGKRAELIKCDVTNNQEVEKALSNLQKNEEEATIEILVNNAGIKKDMLMIFMDESNWKDVLDTSLNGFYFTTKAVINSMLTKKFGRIINIVSLSGIRGMPGQVNYSAAKAGLIGATKALAQEVARRGITVNAVAPGFIRTDMIKDLDENELKNLVPMKRFGEAEEVAEVVAFLASKKASYITGEVISINGGLYT